MAMLKSINKYASAPLAPDPLPAGSLLLVEVNGQVFRLPAETLAVTDSLGNLATLSVPTTEPEEGEVWLDSGVLKVVLPAA